MNFQLRYIDGEDIKHCDFEFTEEQLRLSPEEFCKLLVPAYAAMQWHIIDD